MDGVVALIALGGLVGVVGDDGTEILRNIPLKSLSLYMNCKMYSNFYAFKSIVLPLFLVIVV